MSDEVLREQTIRGWARIMEHLKRCPPRTPAGDALANAHPRKGWARRYLRMRHVVRR